MFPGGLRTVTSSTTGPRTYIITILANINAVVVFFYCVRIVPTVFFLRVEICEEKIQPVLLINESEEKSPLLLII